MSIYLSGTWTQAGDRWTNQDGKSINGYWKQDADGQWHNLATQISVDNASGNKLKIDFTLTDGDWTDSDGQVNGVIVDPTVGGMSMLRRRPGRIQRWAWMKTPRR